MKKNNSGYSIILSILMVGFMLVLTTGVFGLIYMENKDTKAMEYYLKAYAGAQGMNELAMLKAKQNNYGYSYEVSNTLDNNESILLSKNPLDKAGFQKTKNVVLSYKLESTSTGVVDKNLSIGDFDIIPLFTTNPYKKTKNITVNGLSGDVVWNILSTDAGLAGVGNIAPDSLGTVKEASNSTLSQSVRDFLTTHENNYLIIHNASSSDIKYSLKTGDGEKITKDVTNIVSTGEIGGYKQNIRTSIETSKYLNLLKYSIFSEE